MFKLSVELNLLIFFVLIVLLRLISLFFSEKRDPIFRAVYFVPSLILGLMTWQFGVTSQLDSLSFEGIRLSFLVILYGLHLLTLFRGIGRESTSNFFSSIHFFFAVIALGSTDYINLIIALIMCGSVSILQPLLNRKNRFADYSVRLFLVFSINVVAILMACLCFILASGSSSLSSINNADSITLIVSLFFIILSVFIESGALSFSFLLTDFGKISKENTYPIFLINKFLMIAIGLVLVNEYSSVLKNFTALYTALEVLVGVSIVFLIIGSLNVKNTATIVSKLIAINVVMALMLFAMTSDSEVLYNVTIFLGMVFLAATVCLDRTNIDLNNAVPFVGRTSDLIAFSISFTAMSFFPLNSLFIKRFSILVAANEVGLSTITTIYVVGLVILFISSSNIISVIARKIHSFPERENEYVVKCIEWFVAIAVMFGGLLV